MTHNLTSQEISILFHGLGQVEGALWFISNTFEDERQRILYRRLHDILKDTIHKLNIEYYDAPRPEDGQEPSSTEAHRRALET